MSRIIVKNLPPKATEDAVREHFKSKGRITDVKILRKRDGSSRRFGFVGFKSDQEAQEAAKFFNLSFMNSSRLQVDLAKALGDESLEKRKETLKRKRLAQREEEAKPRKAKQTPSETAEPDKKLSEFLEVMQPQRATALWENNNSGGTAHVAEADEDEDDVVDMRTLQTQGLGALTDNATVNSASTGSEAALEDESMGELPEEEEKWVPHVTEDADEDGDDASGKDDEVVSDMDWLRQRQTRIKENGEVPEAVHHAEDDEAMQDTELLDREDSAPAVEQSQQPTPTNRLFVRNLAFSVERAELEELFKPFGTIKEVHIPIDPKTDKMKGLAFVEFNDVDEAARAHADLDGRGFQGRLLHIMFAAPQRSYQLDEFDIKNMPLKKQQALKRRMQAAKQQFSWNSLYMNPDTVLEAAASKMGLTKSQLMDPLSSNMAVKQALAESSVLESVQSFFKSRGVDLNKFSGSKELSDSIILAKNLPFNFSATELQDMFAKFGDVERTLMPPDGGIAIIQYRLSSAGRAAFKQLAFRRVGDSILYLQKAPKGVLSDVAPAAAGNEASPAAAPAPKQAASAREILLPEDEKLASEAAALPEIRTSVFIKNLSFATPLASLLKLLKPLTGFVTAQIKTKPDPQNKGGVLSMGYGFAEFATLRDAETAISALQGHVLDGHSLQLKISLRGKDATTQRQANNATTSKIIVKNIPFETSKKDVVDLFSTFGQLRSVRVPKKFNKQTRGFAFAEFATPKEAEHAMAALQGTHLLGRRLVMDYAEADAEDAETEIARMEAKVAKQVAAVDSQSGRIGRQMKGFDMEEDENEF